MTGSRLNKLETELYVDLLHKGQELINDTYSKEGSIDGYSKRWRYWLAWCDTREDVDPWNPEINDVKNYVRYLESGGQSPNSISARVTAVSVTYGILQEENEVDENPAKDFETSKILDNGLVNQRTIAANKQGPKTQFETISPEEFELMLKHVPEPRNRNTLLLKMMWQLMLRAKEVTTIELDHIEDEENRIWIRDAKKNEGDKDLWYEAYYKNDLQYLLDRWIDKGRQDLSIHARESDYLFLTHQNPQMRPSHVSRIVKRAANNADEARGINPESSEGIQRMIDDDVSGKRTRWKVTAHTLRRSAATYVANKTDYPLHMLADDLNHRSVETTRDSYVMEDDDERRRRRQNIDGL